MKLDYTFTELWGVPINVSFDLTRNWYYAGADMLPTKIDLWFGAEYNKIMYGSIAHEAAHIGKYIVDKTDWKKWSPEWTVRHKKEEAECWVVERVVHHTIKGAKANGISIGNDIRFINHNGKII